MAERHPREEALRRVHGTSALFSAAYGNVGSSIYYALGLVAAFALGLTPVAFAIAGLIFICTAATYVEGTVMYPEAGGSSNFARHAFNEVASFLAGWGQMLNYVITAAISAFFVPHYLAEFWAPLADTPWDVLTAGLLLAVLAAINVKGTQESTRVNFVLALGDLFTQILLVVVGLVLVFNPDTLVSNVELGIAPSWGDFALGIAIGMIAYTGIETISNMAEEARGVARTVPRGAGLVVFAVVILYLLLPLVALSAMPVSADASGAYSTELGTTYADNPVLGIVNNLGVDEGLTGVLRGYVAVLAGVILFTATNAAIIGLSRLTFSMGQYRQLPAALRRIHPRFKTPYVAIIVFTGVAALAMAPGQTEFLATMYSFGAMLSFTIAHISIVRLRRVQPERERPWRPPLNFRFRGVSLPLTAVIGGVGTFAAWVVVIALNLATLAAGLGWMVAGAIGYFLYRRHQGLSPTRTAKVETLEPLGVEEVEYRSVVLALEEGPFPEEVVATARTLAARRRRAIHVIALVTVPTHLPLDAPMEEADAEARSKIERAKLICGQRITGSIVRVRPGQAGQILTERARNLRAAAVVVPLRYRNGQPLYGKTLRTVLRERPCRVIVAAHPEGSVAQ